MTRGRIYLYLGTIGVLLAVVMAWYGEAIVLQRGRASSAFNGDRAYDDVKTQVSFGPRVPGSVSHTRTVDWIKQQLESAGWQVEIQQSKMMGHTIQNIRAYRSEAPPAIIVGAHYDSRIHADRDPSPSKQAEPVPGADDGASGVAVLLELARTLPRESVPTWLVFFDAEDNGSIPGWDWLLGSRAFVQGMDTRPRAMILLDMVGDNELSIPMEGNSDPALRASIWNTAARLGYGDVFPPHVKYTIEDDHLPFIDAGIPSVDIIDIDYPYWHTTSDTPDHVSASSLQMVGNVLWEWLAAQKP
ncbi:MAG TPA: M28 family peptidase [Anaerolineales bacterium]|nr:M28 family peptidase [Anaerolineales bacterium]